MSDDARAARWDGGRAGVVLPAGIPIPSASESPVARVRTDGGPTLVDTERVPGAPRRATDEVLSSLVLLQAVAAGSAPECVRVFSPAPTVAFSRRESLHPHFARAADAARAAGYLPIVRPAGGRAVVLDEDWLVVDLLSVESERRDDGEVFRARGREFADLARSWGVDARVGAVAGEYCPGEWSVNARGAVKLVGTAQRVVRGGRLFTASIPLRLGERAYRLLVEVNAILGLVWDPSTVGSLAEETVVDDEAVRAAVAAHFAGVDAPRRGLREIVGGLDAAVARLAGDRVVIGPESTVDTGAERA